jgi:hypothetical protein
MMSFEKVFATKVSSNDRNVHVQYKAMIVQAQRSVDAFSRSATTTFGDAGRLFKIFSQYKLGVLLSCKAMKSGIFRTGFQNDVE